MGAKAKIGIIGCGNMGSAIMNGIRGKFTVLAAEKSLEQAEKFKKAFGLKTRPLPEVAAKSDIIILAVKPQDFDAVLDEIKPFISKEKLFISIAAGIPIDFINKKLGKNIKVIRTMPNLPLQIGLGMTAIAKSKNAGAQDLDIAVKIFSSVGEVLIVDEKYLNAVTAVSGSGPAYVFLFVELFVESAIKLGFSKEQAIKLVGQTIKGSMALLNQSKVCPKELRAKVTSKGGTTQAAMDVFFASKVDKIFDEALSAACKRAKELSNK
ncbi:MAG: pyrroline-5-carboxylate reductase [Candidatus Omnitrophica bacterium]|nr:pyrroline-5-carboxylate reductase [Candidatus Omnitrophota bacterium]